MINLKGKTPHQAFAAIYEMSGKTVPENVKGMMRQVVGPDGRFGDVTAEVHGDDILIGALLDTEEKRDAAEQMAHLDNFVKNTEVGREMFAKHGTPEYNGGVGDSCPCGVCNLRRAEYGMDLSEDMLKGMTRTESENIATEEYAKLGKDIPADRNTAAGQDAFDKIGKPIIGILEAIMGKIDKVMVPKGGRFEDNGMSDLKAHNLANAPMARKGLEQLIGPDSEGMADFDRMNELYAKKNKTPAELVEFAQKLQRLVELTGMR